ncbi:hypothetical protein GBAR_LOCUS31659 [Geodia barretti]|uniref:Uncharacterized protein n=1 Tax=Geodia barretti TaxID=519541 RepID=A0AA35U2D0_GEOBA|nr:hypothetical protein GBAR_LOCUS31659 [Geodia barretti]
MCGMRLPARSRTVPKRSNVSVLTPSCALLLIWNSFSLINLVSRLDFVVAEEPEGVVSAAEHGGEERGAAYRK